MKRSLSFIPLVALLVWSAACASQKVPAENALKAAESAWAAISAEANRYVPDQAKGIEDALASARKAMTGGEYEAVIKEATDLPAKIADVEKALNEKKGEWNAAWKTLESALGSGLVAVRAKVDELVAARRLPAGVDKATVEGAQTALTNAEQALADAQNAFLGADYVGALAKANQVKANLIQVATDLKLDLPVLKEEGSALVKSAQETIKEAVPKK